jgi:hypothetical protein
MAAAATGVLIVAASILVGAGARVTAPSIRRG